MKEVVMPILSAITILYVLIGAVEFGASDAYRYMSIMAGMQCHHGVCEVVR